jgi:maleylacetoacetate isomerase
MADLPNLELYAYWRSSAGFRVRVAMALKGLTAHEHLIDLETQENRTPEFLAINPAGALPVLIEDGQPPLTQSLAILEYLDELVPSPPLLPADPRGRARVRSLSLALAADTHPLITPRIRRYLMANAGFDAELWRDWQVNWFTAGLQAMERRLASDPETGTFCHGDSLTMADIVLASIPAVAKVFKIGVEGTPTVDRIVARCSELPAFANADPSKQAGAPAP